MAQNEIEEMLDHLRRIKSGSNIDSFNICQITELDMALRFCRTFIKYHHVILPDSLVELTKNAKGTVKMLHKVFDGIPDECKTNLNLERLESHLLEFFEGNTSLSYNYELNDFDLSECMDCLGKNLNDLVMILVKERSEGEPEEGEPEEGEPEQHRIIKQLKIVQKKMRFLTYLYATEINGYVDHEKLEYLETRIQFMADNVGLFILTMSVNLVTCYSDDKDEGDIHEDDILNKLPYLLCLIKLTELEMKKIFLSELKASKFTQSRTFKDKKLPKGFSHHLQSLLVYLRNKKLKKFPNNASAQNIDVAVEFLLVFLDADVSNHVINANWLNEVLLEVGAIAGDVLYVIQKLLPSSINKDDTSKISFCSIQILEKTKDLKAQVETYYKSLKFTPSQFPIFGGLSFLDSLLRKLNEISTSKSGLDFLMKPLLGNLEKELSSLTSILEKELSSLTSIFRDVTKVRREHKILTDLQRRTLNLAYEAEVAVDSILSQYNAFLHIFCSIPTILKEIKQINAEVTEMRSADIPLNPHYEVAPSKHLPIRHINPVTDEEIVGFDIVIEKMFQYLIIRGRDKLDVLPIVGMVGQGKTTIARKVYNSHNIVSHFDVRAWCIVSQTYTRRNLLKVIITQVTGSKNKGDKDDEFDKDDELADELRKKLIGKRYLIVLDDMWDCMAWDDLWQSFPDFRKRSRIVVTTRLEKVGEHVKQHTDIYSLPFLTTEESCKLLQKKVFLQEDCPPELQDVSQAVAEKCKGLPLVVVMVAGIIKKRKMEESWWNKVKEALFDYLDRESEEYSLATMHLSFDNLPDCLKPCLLYMGMFPEDTIISASKLISLWIAEGFVDSTESGRLMEEEAEGYLMDLISSNMVMPSKRSCNGKVKYCQVHDVVHHFCLEKSREEKFMLAVKGHSIQFQPLDWKGRRVSFSFTEELSKLASLVSVTQKPFHQHLRSLIIKGGYYTEDIYLRQVIALRLLKVLDLSSCRLSAFSSVTLKPLIHLKHLTVSTKKFNFHPEPHLPHLETLIVERLLKDMLLPAIFWKMEKLRRVEIGRAILDLKWENHMQGMFEESSKLKNLRILRGVVIHEGDRVDVLLQRCPNLQQLDIIFRGDADSAEICLNLESLTQLCLSFQSPHILSGLQLPSNLNKLVLLGFNRETDIPLIEGLSSLEYLTLKYINLEEWCFGGITFHKLKKLKLVDLVISRWDVSEESFPLLEILVIKWCDKLEEIPLSFADISTLKQIKLIWCDNKSLQDSAVRIKEEAEAIEESDRIDITIQNT